MVVIHLGTNGAFNSGTFDRVMAELINIDLVVFVNSRVPRRWEGIVNSALESGTERWENAELLDWKRVADAHAEWFKEDRVHLSTTGRQSYARLIAGAIDRAFEAPINDADR